MKRKLLLFILLTLLLTLGVHAADTVRLEELGLSIDVPSEYYVITRNMDPNDPDLGVFDMDSEQVTALLEKNDVYLDLMNEDDAFELTISMSKNEERTMNQFTDDALDSMADTLADQFDSSGLTVHSVQHFIQDSTVFFQIFVSGEQDGDPLQLLRYYTVHNYQTVVMDLLYWGSSLPENYERLAKSMIASIRFDQVDEVAQTVSSATEEEQFSLIEESAAAKKEESGTSSLIASSYGSQSNTGTATQKKKQRFPTIPVVLGVALVSAILGVVIRRDQKKRAMQSDTPAAAGKQKASGQRGSKKRG
jgi:hypothetical protein